MLTRINKGNSSYVVYPLGDQTVQIDKVSMMMINSNQDKNIGLALISLEEMNGQYFEMLFDVTGKVPLQEYLKMNISQADFRKTLLNLISTLEGFDEYMIDVRQVLLTLDSVYINSFDQSISFICIALKNELQTGNLHQFFRDVVQGSNVNANSNEISYFNRVWNVISSESGFSLSNIRKAMDSENEVSLPQNPQLSVQDPTFPKVPEVQRIDEPEIITVTSSTTRKKEEVLPVPEIEDEEDKKGGIFNIFSSGKKKKPDSSLLSAFGNMTKKGQKQPETEAPEVHLIKGISGFYAGGNFEIETGEEIKIGSDAKSCQIIINDEKVNPVHCVISYQSKKKSFIVVDKSISGTFTEDGKRLPAGKSTPCSSGTIIVLGSTAHKFQLE